MKTHSRKLRNTAIGLGIAGIGVVAAKNLTRKQKRKRSSTVLSHVPRKQKRKGSSTVLSHVPREKPAIDGNQIFWEKNKYTYFSGDNNEQWILLKFEENPPDKFIFENIDPNNNFHKWTINRWMINRTLNSTDGNPHKAYATFRQIQDNMKTAVFKKTQLKSPMTRKLLNKSKSKFEEYNINIGVAGEKVTFESCEMHNIGDIKDYFISTHSIAGISRRSQLRIFVAGNEDALPDTDNQIHAELFLLFSENPYIPLFESEQHDILTELYVLLSQSVLNHTNVIGKLELLVLNLKENLTETIGRLKTAYDNLKQRLREMCDLNHEFDADNFFYKGVTRRTLRQFTVEEVEVYMHLLSLYFRQAKWLLEQDSIELAEYVDTLQYLYDNAVVVKQYVDIDDTLQYFNTNADVANQSLANPHIQRVMTLMRNMNVTTNRDFPLYFWDAAWSSIPNSDALAVRESANNLKGVREPAHVSIVGTIPLKLLLGNVSYEAYDVFKNSSYYRRATRISCKKEIPIVFIPSFKGKINITGMMLLPPHIKMERTPCTSKAYMDVFQTADSKHAVWEHQTSKLEILDLSITDFDDELFEKVAGNGPKCKYLDRETGEVTDCEYVQYVGYHDSNWKYCNIKCHGQDIRTVVMDVMPSVFYDDETTRTQQTI